MTQLRKGEYKPVYLLMGTESYFIDSITDYIENRIIPEEEKDFNQIVSYAIDTNMHQVLERARAYPMMGERQVIIVKEAQLIQKTDRDWLELIQQYLVKPQESTILVFAYKHGTVDRRKKAVAQIAQTGVLFESKTLGDSDTLNFIQSYASDHGASIDIKGCTMLYEYLGADLCKIVNELDKILNSFQQEQEKEITPSVIESQVGISKDYNIFEFREALAAKDIFKANQIASYYEKNPKTHPLQKELPIIFQYFANLMLAYYAQDRSERGIASQLGMKSTWGVRIYMTGMRNYNASEVLKIIGDIRYTLARAQGFETTSASTEGLLRELVFRILH